MLPLLIRVDDVETQTSTLHAFTSGEVRIGRSALNDLCLDDPAISQYHAVIAFDAEATRYTDLGGVNGTLRAGEPLPSEEPVVVTADVPLELGPLRLTLKRGTAPPVLTTPGATFAERLGASTPARRANTVMRSAATAAYVPPARAPEGPVPATPGTPAASPPAPAAYAATHLAHDGHGRSGGAAPAAAYGATVRPSSNGAREPTPAAVPVTATTPDGVAAEALARLRDCAVHFGIAPPQTSADVEDLLVRLVRTLKTFGGALVSVRDADTTFRADVLRGRRGTLSPLLDAARDARAVVAYLLDPRAPLDARADELRGAFAALLAHQAALLSGALRGARALLLRISPATLDVELARAGGGGFLVLFLRAFREAELWRRFVARHGEILGGKEFEAVVLGPDFARAYQSVAGERRATPGASSPPVTR